MGQITGINGVQKTTYGNVVQILFAPENAISISIRLANTGIAADGDGKKIIKAGTPLAGNLLDRTATPFVKATTTAATSGTLTVPSGGGTVVLPTPATSNAVGVLLHDTDVTSGECNAQCCIFGVVDTSISEVQPSAEEIAALKGRITFIK